MRTLSPAEHRHSLLVARHFCMHGAALGTMIANCNGLQCTKTFCLDREPMKPVPVNAVNLARLLRRFPNATRSRPRVCFPSRTSSHMFYMLRGVTRCHMSHVVVVHAVAPQLCSSALCVTKRCRDRDRDPRDPRDIDLGHGGHGIDGIDGIDVTS